MRRPTRVQVYDGLYRSQADERFEADAAEAARHGWRAVEGRWNGEQLAVTYVHEGPGWNRKQPKAQDFAPNTEKKAGAPGPKRRRIRRYTSALVQSVVFLALLAAVIVSIFGVALIADVGDIREMAKDLPKPIPKMVKDYLEWVKSIRG
jgi:hypothetical protein